MRVMTGDAADARIGPVEALAVHQAIGLEADVGLASPVVPHNRLPTAVALAAEVRNVCGGQFSQAWRDGAHVALHDASQVGAGAGVAVFAGESRLEGGQV